MTEPGYVTLYQTIYITPGNITFTLGNVALCLTFDKILT